MKDFEPIYPEDITYGFYLYDEENEVLYIRSKINEEFEIRPFTKQDFKRFSQAEDPGLHLRGNYELIRAQSR
jgi:hypothetical protein